MKNPITNVLAFLSFIVFAVAMLSISVVLQIRNQRIMKRLEAPQDIAPRMAVHLPKEEDVWDISPYLKEAIARATNGGQALIPIQPGTYRFGSRVEYPTNGVVWDYIKLPQFHFEYLDGRDYCYVTLGKTHLELSTTNAADRWQVKIGTNWVDLPPKN